MGSLCLVNQSVTVIMVHYLLFMNRTKSPLVGDGKERTMKKFAFVLAMFLLVWAGSAAAQERELTKEETVCNTPMPSGPFTRRPSRWRPTR